MVRAGQPVSSMNPLRLFPRSGGITRRLARVVMLQLFFISVITALGVIVAAQVLDGVLMRTALEEEADHFWERYGENPFHPLPDTDNMVGYLHDPDGNYPVPEYLLDQEEGFGHTEVEGKRALMLVDKKAIHGQTVTLYLIFDAESVSLLSFYFGVVPLIIVLIVIYLSAWVAFRHSRLAISPVVTLAGRLRRFHSDEQPEVTLDLRRLKSKDPEDEINILVDSLNAFTGEINELIQRERRFTRDVSHELRTPLSVIQGSAELLASSGELDRHQRKTAERVLRTARDMNALMEALMLLARGTLQEPGCEQVSINEVVGSQLQQLQLTHNPDDHLVVHVIYRQVVTVTATRQLVDAICGNLLRNAFNYTREGEITVLLGNGFLEVTNRGKGVKPLPVEQLFEPFVRGRDSDEAEGHGVGLDIVRRLCELYGWDVEGCYSLERGMVFTVSFETEDADG